MTGKACKSFKKKRSNEGLRACILINKEETTDEYKSHCWCCLRNPGRIPLVFVRGAGLGLKASRFIDREEIFPISLGRTASQPMLSRQILRPGASEPESCTSAEQQPGHPPMRMSALRRQHTPSNISATARHSHLSDWVDALRSAGCSRGGFTAKLHFVTSLTLSNSERDLGNDPPNWTPTSVLLVTAVQISG